MNLSQKIFHYYFVIIVLIGCKELTSNDKYCQDYEKISDGLYFKLNRLGVKEEKIDTGDVIRAYITFSRDSSLAFYSSLNVFKVSLPINNFDINHAFLNMGIGDSATVIVQADSFYLNMLHDKIPDFISKEMDLFIGIKIIGKVDLATNTKSSSYEELNELKEMISCISKYNLILDTISKGIYYKIIETTEGKKIVSGDEVIILYKGSLPDGKVFDDATDEAFSFIYGVDGQIIPGLNYLLGNMCYGEKAKVLIPSILAFGERGSSDQRVPPFTPVLYYVEVFPECLNAKLTLFPYFLKQ